MKNVAILGSYNSKQTWLHLVDARAKLIMLIILLVTTCMIHSVWGLCLIAGLLAVAWVVSRADVRALQLAIKPLLVITLVSLLVNGLVLDGTGTIDLIGPVGLTSTGLARSAQALARVYLLLGFFLVVSATTTAPQIAHACGRFLQPLARFGIPVGDASMVLSLALRFVPICAEEFERIMMAQKIRGVRFDKGSIKQRLKKWLSVLVPVVVGLFRKADELAISMQDRCYSSAGRRYESKPMHARDMTVLTIVVLASILACMM
ncbi:energy-coupling factor transporter transmembrane component T family protein [Atopobium fossor]|uniref:energy-coupling factor transporter transmembrane component T family protein n=1 Tax=Atopobium fossor TaxID=39487 RepID=UPI0004269D35|nr:energy-coupling factor transporter transmembrane component T [Atopobium fossor]